MRMRNIELAVGAFMFLGVLALAVLAFQVSGLNNSQQRQSYTLTARFDNISGLTRRAKVSAAGVTIGRVSDISLDAEDYMAVVTMSIDADVDFLTIDSIASIQTAGVLGEKYIGISIGGDEELLGDGDEIDDTASAIVLEELIGKVMASFSK